MNEINMHDDNDDNDDNDDQMFIIIIEFAIHHTLTFLLNISLRNHWPRPGDCLIGGGVGNGVGDGGGDGGDRDGGGGDGWDCLDWWCHDTCVSTTDWPNISSTCEAIEIVALGLVKKISAKLSHTTLSHTTLSLSKFVT